MLIFNYFEQGDEKKGDQGTDYEVNLNLKAQEIIVHAGRVRVRHRRSCWGLCGWRRPYWPWRGWSGWRGGWGPWTGWWGSVVRPLGTVWNSNECLQHTHTLSWTPSNFYKMVNIWVAGFASCMSCWICELHISTFPIVHMWCILQIIAFTPLVIFKYSLVNRLWKTFPIWKRG